MTTAVAGVVDATLVTALGLLVCAALRRRPAALRHVILAASLAAAATAPLLEATLPHWAFPVLSSTSQVTSAGLAFNPESAEAATTPTPMPVATTFTWTAMFVAAWSIGFLVVMAGLLAGLVRLVSMTRHCQPAPSSVWRERTEALSRQHGLNRPVIVLESPDRALLLTWGLFRPRIIVPAVARSWTAERIEVVLAHEFAHIARRDWAVQIAAETLRAVYWFNPLIWIACRRLRDESEQACDDTVLRRGIDAADYASHLLAVARQVLTAGRGLASAPAVANASTLERRIAAMLNASRNREPLTRAVRASAVLAMLAVTIPVASATLTEHVVASSFAPAVLHDVALIAPEPATAPKPPAVAAQSLRRAAVPRAAATPPAQAPATFSGRLLDTSGGTLPGVSVTLTDTVSGMVYSTTSDANGAFAVRNLPPSSYQFKASLPGFATITNVVTLSSGENLQTKFEMRVGALIETVTVVCPVGGAALAPRAASAVLAFDSRPATTRLFAQQVVPVRVGGNIAVPRQVKRVPPVCPGNLPANGFVVILEGTIGADGLVTDIKALRPKPGDQQLDALAQSAMDAVRQWEYTPARLNNVPIAVIVTVTVVYGRQ